MTAFTVSVADSIASIPAVDWDRCAGAGNPFVSHAFLTALEASGSATPETGWTPLHLVARDAGGAIAGVMPAYGKSHSYGEYVFDHSWADAFSRAGGDYYPKLQIAVPFTPATGPRLLLADRTAAAPLLAGARSLVERAGLSSAHATFIAPEQVPLFKADDWLIRHDQQFHWVNRGYGSFDDFLATLASRKRKAIRRERQQARESGLDIRALTGTALDESHWNALWAFYQDTGARKWGRPYLTREAFSRIGAAMADRVLLVLAYRGDRPVAGAFNMIGADTLYGRYWGCTEHHPMLHFELCYYQAIDFAIARGLATVEAGAQGEHKLARGYEPVRTTSAHWIAHPGFRRAVADFLERERHAVAADIAYLGRFTPYRRGPGPAAGPDAAEDHD